MLFVYFIFLLVLPLWLWFWFWLYFDWLNWLIDWHNCNHYYHLSRTWPVRIIISSSCFSSYSSWLIGQVSSPLDEYVLVCTQSCALKFLICFIFTLSWWIRALHWLSTVFNLQYFTQMHYFSGSSWIHQENLIHNFYTITNFF